MPASCIMPRTAVVIIPCWISASTAALLMASDAMLLDCRPERTGKLSELGLNLNPLLSGGNRNPVLYCGFVKFLTSKSAGVILVTNSGSQNGSIKLDTSDLSTGPKTNRSEE